MATTEISTASWSGFYDNDPWLNEENWKKFFGPKIPSGTPHPEMVENEWNGALQPHVYHDGQVVFDPGVIFVNGYAVEFDTQITTTLADGDHKFFFVRLNPETHAAKIMAKDITDAETEVPKAFKDPSWQCQDENDVPLLYADRTVSPSNVHAFDLRRFVSTNGNRIVYITMASDAPIDNSCRYGYAYDSDASFSRLYPFGGAVYKIDIAAENTGTNLYIAPTAVPSIEPIVITVTNQKSADFVVALTSDTSSRNRFLWASDWSSNTKTIAAGESLTFILVPAYFDGWYSYWLIISGP